MKITEISNPNYWKEDIENDIILKNIQKNNRKKMIHEVEHSFCDFQQMILGQKIRKFKKHKPESPRPNYFFDDYELSKLLSREIDDENIDFYKGETVQKLISCQWVITQFWWK